MNPGFHCTGQMADSVYGIVWVSGLLMSTLWIKWPMVTVGLWYGQAYVIDNEHKWILLMVFWIHRDTVTRSWGPLLCHSSMTIISCCSMIMHGPMLQGSVHNSWKLKTSWFLHGQNTHRTCHPLNMFGMLWIGVYNSVFQFLSKSSNFTQPLKRSGSTFQRPQSTTWSTLCKGDALHCVRQMEVTPDTDWFLDPQYSKTGHFGDTSFPAQSSTWLHRYYLNWTKLDNAITKFNNEMHSADNWVLNPVILHYWYNLPILILCSALLQFVLLKALYK